MASYAECLAALPAFQNDLLRERTLAQPAVASAFAFSAFATSLANIHATGVGIRYKLFVISAADF